MKFNFEDNTQTLEYQLPNGEFGTEPIFVPRKHNIYERKDAKEDDGYVIFQTINGIAEKSGITILSALDMSVVFRGKAPELGLFGLHSAFFPYDVGCTSEQSCRPISSKTTTPTGTTTTKASATKIDITILPLIVLLTHGITMFRICFQ